MAASHFLRVPVEIRLRIYEFSLDADTDCPGACVGSPKRWHQVGRKPVYYRRYGCLRHHSSTNLDSGIVYTCKQIFHEAFPVFFAVNTFKFINNRVSKESLGMNFDRIRRLELYTWFWESRDIILPASCRSLKLTLWRGFNSKCALEDFPVQTHDNAVIPRWVATLTQWKKAGVREIIMSHLRGDIRLHRCMMAISEKAGVVWAKDRLCARDANTTL